MKIVIDENIPFAELFAQHGEIVTLPGREIRTTDLIDASALIVRSVTQVNSELLKGSAVQYVGSATAGTDHLDTHWLEQNSIACDAAPGCNARAVVEYVLCVLNHLNVSLAGKRFGIIGCGSVGGRLHKQLRELGVSCAVYDPFLSSETQSDLASLEEVLSCDVISMHTPLTHDGDWPTYQMLGANELSKIGSESVLLNCGRGAVIDELALKQRIQQDGLAVVLDVWEGEPHIDKELLDLVALGTPHIAGYTLEGKVRGTQMVYRAFCDQFGLLAKEPESWWEVGLPLNGTDDLDSATALREVYDPSADYQSLRDVMASDVSGKGFDSLRKNHPLRREFSSYSTKAFSTELGASLESLGFGIDRYI